MGILGTGTMAAALTKGWQRAGHDIVITGRSVEKAQAIAHELSERVSVVDPGALAHHSDVVVVAIAWEGMKEALQLVGATNGQLAGLPVVDCTNPIDWTTGASKLSSGSAVEYIAGLTAGAHVVKALHLYAGQSWLTDKPDRPRVVALAGDNDDALAVTSALVCDLGGVPVVIGGIDCGRQLEEVAGFVVRLVRSGVDPTTAVPSVPAG